MRMKINNETIVKILDKIAESNHYKISEFKLISRYVRMNNLFLKEMDGEFIWCEERSE